jgi:large subunit ribosomal protein L9
MKVILNQDVRNLGEEGDVCEVKPGYARNFLMPQKMAVLYSKQNLAILESRRSILEKKKEEKRQAALGLKDKLESITIKLVISAGDNGKLFGSVTNATIADELQKHGLVIERKKIELPEHSIKMQGNYKAKIRLYDNQEAIVAIEINQKDIPAPKEEAPKAKAEAPKAEAPEGQAEAKE